MAVPVDIEEARQKLEAEHAEVMESLGDVWVRVEAIRASKPTDNVHDLLKELEGAVKEARDGGMIGSGWWYLLAAICRPASHIVIMLSKFRLRRER